MAKYDDLIEEASGELDRVEGQLYSATQQLLDLQGRLSQLTQEAHAADKTKLRVKPCLSLFAHSCCMNDLRAVCMIMATACCVCAVRLQAAYMETADACCANADGWFPYSKKVELSKQQALHLPEKHSLIRTHRIDKAFLQRALAL